LEIIRQEAYNEDRNHVKMETLLPVPKDQQPVDTAIVTSEDIAEKLEITRLPEDSHLSVLVVGGFWEICIIFNDHIYE